MNISQPMQRERETQSIVLWATNTAQVRERAARSRLTVARKHCTQYTWLDREFSNLHGCISWLINQKSTETIQLLSDYIELLELYLRQRGLVGELVDWCEVALQNSKKLQTPPAKLRLVYGQALYALGRWSEAKACFLTAISESPTHNSSLHARSLLALGLLQFNQGEYQMAFQTMESAKAFFSQETDFEVWVTIRAEVAAYHLNRQELDKALAIYLEIDQLRQEAGASESTDHTLLMLGVVHRKKKDYMQAINYLQQLYQRGEQQKNPSAAATAAHHMAWTYLEQRDLLQARRFCGKAIMLYEQIGDARGTSDAYEQLGSIALVERNGKEALYYLQRALALKREHSSQQGSASCLRRLACAFLLLHRPKSALEALSSSLRIYHRLGILTRHRLLTILNETLQYIGVIKKLRK